MAQIKQDSSGMEYVTMSIRLPKDLWRTLRVLILEGEIDSINQAIVEALNNNLRTGE